MQLLQIYNTVLVHCAPLLHTPHYFIELIPVARRENPAQIVNIVPTKNERQQQNF